MDSDPELEKTLRKQYQDNLDKAYKTDAVHPGKPLEYIGGGGYRHYQLVKVRFTPMSYHALSKRLNIIPKAVVTIEYEPSDDPVEVVKSSPEIERMASEIIANYDDVKTAYESAALQSGVLSTDTHPYVIICPASLQNSVKVLYNWEISKGNNPIIVTVEQIESESTGIDRAERIRNFLRSKLGVWGIQYVLLVGTLIDIPVRYYGYPGSDGMKGPTDYYYAELSLPDNQSWDYNQDGIYAERGDDYVDFIAEVHVGRLPFNAPEVVESACRRIVEFEYMNDMTYKKRALLAMSFLDENTDSAILSEKIAG